MSEVSVVVRQVAAYAADLDIEAKHMTCAVKLELILEDCTFVQCSF